MKVPAFAPPTFTITLSPSTSGEADAPHGGNQASSPSGLFVFTPQYSFRQSCFHSTRPEVTSRQWNWPPRPNM